MSPIWPERATFFRSRGCKIRSHAGGGIAGASAHTTAFVARMGGGLDVPITTHIAVRVV